MDAMYRKKSAQEKAKANSNEVRRNKKHAGDGYTPKVRPRETHPDSVDAKKRIKGNLKQLNKRLVDHPVAVKEEEAQSVAMENEDRGAKVVTRSIASVSPIPIAYILTLFLVAMVFMYVVSLYVQVEEYSRSIDDMESRIAELKEESTRLEVQLESKYDLGEVERIATQEYGMVVSSTLPKKYISVSAKEDIWEEAEKEDDENFLEQFVSGISKMFGQDEE
ncbi:MAG: hypothetical protein E7580_05055 [Ruminococcaceae bacterium]|nr:hypothetical protein [Oscillospiraceae bacterium]